jgi:hypothetical protein
LRLTLLMLILLKLTREFDCHRYVVVLSSLVPAGD